MPTLKMLPSLSLSSALLVLVTLAASCSPTRLYISTDQPEVRQVFVVAGGLGTLRPIFNDGSSRTLGDYAQNLPNSSFDHTTLRLASGGDSVNVWTSVTEPRTDFLDYEISPAGGEVKVSLKQGAFKKMPDTALGVIVLTDSATRGQKYFGTLFDTPIIEPTGFSLIASGPSLRVALPGDAAPVWFKAD